MKKLSIVFLSLICLPLMLGANGGGCDEKTSDSIQQEQQEKILAEGSSQIGMPSIKNFRERKILKDIYELRDQDGLTTYTYTFSEQTGRLKFFGITIGYGIPYSTQFTNPEKATYVSGHGYFTMPQADPNGLFSPTAAEGTWILMKDPNSPKVLPVYLEPRVVVSPFKLSSEIADYPEK